MTAAAGKPTASQSTHLRMGCFRSAFDVTGKTVRLPPAETALPRSCPLGSLQAIADTQATGSGYGALTHAPN